MGILRPQSKNKLIVGLLSGDADLLREAERRLVKEFGPVDLRSECWPFEFTDYYRDELGDQILRQFVSFERLISAERLAEIKRLTNDIEQQLGRDSLSDRPGRPVNIDPGYLTLAKLVLATTKDQAHRIYLERGILAEVTLRFADGRWQPWPWTYPDYAAPTYHPFFNKVRELLKG